MDAKYCRTIIDNLSPKAGRLFTVTDCHAHFLPTILLTLQLGSDTAIEVLTLDAAFDPAIPLGCAMKAMLRQHIEKAQAAIDDM